jgi:hypothetical protein
MNGWILSHRNKLVGLWLALAIVCLVEVMGFHGKGQLTTGHSSLVFLFFALPFFLLGIVQLALMYGSWFKVTATANGASSIKRGFFWVLLSSFAAASMLLLWQFWIRVL